MKTYLYNSLANNGIRPAVPAGAELVDAVGMDYAAYLKGLNPYLKNLPTVYVNGMEKLFINNMGFGIDGYCCEVADQIKEKSPQEKINYSGIAIKGLLFHFHPCHAEVTVDGVKHTFENVWIAPTMKGKYYGADCRGVPLPLQAEGPDCLPVYFQGRACEKNRHCPKLCRQ